MNNSSATFGIRWDPVSLRLAVAWAAAALVGLWVSQLAMHSAYVLESLRMERALSDLRDWTLCMQWSAVSALALCSLYLLQIPRLRFSFPWLVGLVAGAVVVQMLLLSASSPVSVRALTERGYRWYYEVDDFARIVSSSAEEDEQEHGRLEEELYGSHILGSLTVSVIPYSSAELNPDGKIYCVRLKRPSMPVPSVRVPILLVGIPPWTLVYSFVDLATGTETVHSIEVAYESDAETPTKGVGFFPFAPKVPRAEEEESKRKWIVLTTDVPGSYQLRSLHDVKGPGAVSKSIVAVSVCPEAFWKRETVETDALTPAATMNEKLVPLQRTACKMDSAAIQALLYGTPPLSFTYYRRIGDHQLSNITVTNVDEKQEYQAVRKLGTASAFLVDLDLGEFESSNKYAYFVTKITDGNGHQTEYTEAIDSDQNGFQVLGRPIAKFVCSESADMLVVTDERNPELARPGRSIPVSISASSQFPYSFAYSIETESGVIIEKVDNVQQSTYDLPITLLGTYRLLNITDKICTGTVEMASCKVSRMTPPTIDIRSKPIETPCFGQIGLSFDLNLTGMGPWTVWYNIAYRSAPAQRKSVTLRKPSDQINIRPPNPGVYTVTFESVQDSRYPDGVPIRDISATQMFHAPSSARISDYDRQVCMGDKAGIVVQLSGSGPWTLSYQITGKSFRKDYQLDVSEATYSFSTPVFNDAGTHYVELKSVRDGNGCLTDLKTASNVQIEVIEQRPTAVFYSEDVISAASSVDTGVVSMKMLRGTGVSLPVYFAGHPPFTVAVEFSDDQGSSWHELAPFTSSRLDGTIPASKPGIYRLKHVKDRVCSGSVLAPDHLNLSVIAQPTLSITRIQNDSLERNPETLEAAVCQNEKAVLALTIAGKPPFSVGYTLKYDPCPEKIFKGNKCRVISEEKVFRFAQREPILDLNTEAPGEYVYSLRSVSDDHYDQVALRTENSNFHLRVHPRPDLAIRRRNSATHLCVNSLLPPAQAIRMELEGKAPWRVSYDVVLDSTDSGDTAAVKTILRDVFEISQTPYDFVPTSTFAEIGRYRFHARGVTDGNGCNKTLSVEQSSESFLEVSVSPEPSLNFLGVEGSSMRPGALSFSCVGETVELVIQGIPPFRLLYTYVVNGTEQEKVLDLSDPKKLGANGIFSSIRDAKLFDHHGGRGSRGSNLIAKKVRLRPMDEGVLRLKQICHGKSEDDADSEWCCRQLERVEHSVFGLPSAVINSGAHETDVIREGNESEMTVEFRGHAPFMFTYVRKSEDGQELDSHTFTDIQEPTYRLKIAQAGTFKVTSIGDRYCRFPPNNRKKHAMT